jgi:hypothetical protein
MQGIAVRDATVKSMSARRGRLTIVLRRPAGTVLVKLSSRALHESAGLRTKARRHRVRFLKLTVAVTTAARQHVTLTRAVKPRS